MRRAFALSGEVQIEWNRRYMVARRHGADGYLTRPPRYTFPSRRVTPRMTSAAVSRLAAGRASFCRSRADQRAPRYDRRQPRSARHAWRPLTADCAEITADQRRCPRCGCGASSPMLKLGTLTENHRDGIRQRRHGIDVEPVDECGFVELSVGTITRTNAAVFAAIIIGSKPGTLCTLAASASHLRSNSRARFVPRLVRPLQATRAQSYGIRATTKW